MALRSYATRPGLLVVFSTLWLSAGCALRWGEVAEADGRSGAAEAPSLGDGTGVGEATDDGDFGDEFVATTASALTATPHLFLGVPKDRDPSDDYLMVKPAYALSYNGAKLVPNWVSWKLDRADFGKTKRGGGFRADPLLPSEFYKVTDRDYTNSGFDRGHLCPSAERTSSREYNAMTFLTTNIIPQEHNVNNGPWKGLEDYEQSLAERDGKRLFIIAGSIFTGPARTISRGIRVPDALFKIVVVTSPSQSLSTIGPNTPVYAVLMPNTPASANRPWTSFQVSVDSLEAATGYDFLSNVSLEVQSTLERNVATVP